MSLWYTVQILAVDRKQNSPQLVHGSFPAPSTAVWRSAKTQSKSQHRVEPMASDELLIHRADVVLLIRGLNQPTIGRLQQSEEGGLRPLPDFLIHHQMKMKSSKDRPNLRCRWWSLRPNDDRQQTTGSRWSQCRNVIKQNGTARHAAHNRRKTDTENGHTHNQREIIIEKKEKRIEKINK